jgi:Uma2 family endonuclease
MRSAARYTRLPAVPPLIPSQRLKQPEFHRRYEQYPDDVKFELIGGVVYMASPLRRRHSGYHASTSGVLWLYAGETPGIELLDNTTTILGSQSEPQPDLELRILSAFGGQSFETVDDYVRGAPEHITEIADSSKDIDLREKRTDYERAGVIEYLVVCITEQELHWFHFPSGKMIKPDRHGVHRSRVFPGLWIDGPALLRRDSNQLAKVLRQGLASPGHARCVTRLQAARRKHSPRR